MEPSVYTVGQRKIWTYWQGIVEIVLRILILVFGAFPACVSAGVFLKTTLQSISLYGFHILPDALAIPAVAIVLFAGFVSSMDHFITLILKLSGFTSLEILKKNYFIRSIGSSIAQAVFLFIGGILAAVSNSPLSVNDDATTNLITSVRLSSQLSSASSCAAFSIIGAILCGVFAGWEIALALNVWKI